VTNSPARVQSASDLANHVGRHYQWSIAVDDYMVPCGYRETTVTTTLTNGVATQHIASRQGRGVGCSPGVTGCGRRMHGTLSDACSATPTGAYGRSGRWFGWRDPEMLALAGALSITGPAMIDDCWESGSRWPAWEKYGAPAVVSKWMQRRFAGRMATTQTHPGVANAARRYAPGKPMISLQDTVSAGIRKYPDYIGRALRRRIGEGCWLSKWSAWS